MNDNLTVKPRRIETNLRHFARIGYSADGGMNRLAFSRTDLRVRQLLLHVMHNLGLTTRIDGFGNVFGRMEGREPGLPPLLIGSHLDAVPGGGRFDGSIGVTAALEVVACFRDSRLTPRYPLEVVSFASEESSRFGRGTLGSGIVAGTWEPDEILDLTDSRGFTLRRVLQRAGLDPTRVGQARRRPGDFLAYLEMHIEQGRVLEDRQAQIGVVEGIAAPTRLRVRVDGQADHSGATPMGLRRDALTGASEIILTVERLAQEAGNVVGTVGAARVDPGAINVVPGRVDLLVDIRSIAGEAKASVVAQLRAEIDRIALRRDLRTSIQILTDEEPVLLDRRVIAAFEQRCEARGTPWLRMMSGAGHDAMHIAQLCPAGMILAPSHNGISHHRTEWTDLKDIVAGAQIFADTALELVTNGVVGD
jgi:hydantoinase/carbamoylase family amidase